MSGNSKRADGPVPAPRQFGAWYPWYAVIVLTLAATISAIDRQVLALMIGPVKRDLQISDTQMGLLLGAAFATLHTLASFPMARLADRYSRKWIIAGGIFCWSLLTAASALAHRYSTLFLARMGVGVSEASLPPAAYSMMSDYFSQKQLPLAVGIFQSATFFGVGFASFVGGPLIQHLEMQPALVVPIVGDMYPWQAAFLVVGLPGVLVAVLAAGLREPARTGRVVEVRQSVPIADIVRFARARWVLLSLHFGGFFLMALQGYSLFAWGAEYFIRAHEMSRAQAGVSFGLVAMIFGILGSFSGGAIATWLMARGYRDGPMRLAALKCVIVTPFAVAFGLMGEAWSAVAAMVPLTFLMALTPGLGAAVMQTIAPNEMRGQMVAVYLTFVNFFALLLAPLIVALLTEFVFRSEGALGYSLSVLAAMAYPTAAVLLWLALKPYRQALEAAAGFGITRRA
ncbi:MAG: MFS transporter [Phenylobacterium sp.]|uniref:MFS transporter n=1 Tax=Phenylobacterium sp. TaxID=1871053 RepID=UPI00121F9C79|nr:MFS transporter [Phenylobacterium sp.]TAL32797.1 MAG: MFS transporter [Phenylobacterium sp.]